MTPKASTSKKSVTPKTSASKKKDVKSEIKSESPENKPLNGQSKDDVEDEKTDDGKTLKVQSAGAGHAGADYNPSKKKYHPVKDAFWNRGEK